MSDEAKAPVQAGASEFAIPRLPSRTDGAPAEAALVTVPVSSRAVEDARPRPSHSHVRSADHDAVVQGTSDDALLSKYSAVLRGYFQDPYLAAFLRGGPLDSEAARAARRAPIIHRGYWARVQAFAQVVQEFMQAGEVLATKEQEEAADVKQGEADTSTASATPSHAAVASALPAAPLPAIPAASPYRSPFSLARPTPSAPPAPFTPLPNGRPASLRKQIVSLGAGSDTTYFRLKEIGLAPALYAEVDFRAPLGKKAGVVRRTPAMRELVQRRNETLSEQEYAEAVTMQEARTMGTRNAAAGGLSDVAPTSGPSDSLHLPGAHDYALVGADLRDTAALERELLAAGVDFSLPTLVLCECVLVYLPAEASSAVLALLADRFRQGGGGMLLVSYEQLHPETPFGQTMLANLSARGCPLLGLPAYPSLASHADRYRVAGFDAHAGWSMADIYAHYLAPREEVARVERLERFDEVEEWNLLQRHYHISMACVEGREQAQERAAEGGASQAPPQDADSTPTNRRSARIPWRQLGLLNPALQHARAHPAPAVSASHPPGSIVTASGRTIVLGVPAGRPGGTAIGVAQGSGAAAAASNKGSLRRAPQPAHATVQAAAPTVNDV